MRMINLACMALVVAMLAIPATAKADVLFLTAVPADPFTGGPLPLLQLNSGFISGYHTGGSLALVGHRPPAIIVAGRPQVTVINQRGLFGRRTTIIQK